MDQNLICQSGHRWNPALDARPSLEERLTVCPICGANVEVFSLHESASAPPFTSEHAVDNGQTAPHWTHPQVDGYDILEQIGSGAMGVVFRARQLQVNRIVALKLFDQNLGPRSPQRSRFHVEAESLARLNHPNIVQIFDAGEHQGRPYLALEYVTGGNLAQRVRGEPVPARDAAQLVMQVAEGVEAAHQQGIVHRDLKPANILLTGAVESPVSESVPKITDFHLAKQLDEQVWKTKTGAILGTPSYMAPEQIDSDAGGVSPLVDVYALGVILYELLTGNPPFLAATTMQILSQVREREPTPPTQVNRQIPRDLETICLQAMAKEPARRYATAGRLAEDLRNFLEGKPITARAASSTERFWRWCRRNPRIAALTMIVAALLVVVAFVSVTAAVVYRDVATRAEKDRQAATAAGRREADQRTRAETAQHEAEVAKTAAQMALADSYREQGLAAAEQNDPALALLYFAHATRVSPKGSDRKRANRIRFRNWLSQVRIPVQAHSLASSDPWEFSPTPNDESTVRTITLSKDQARDALAKLDQLLNPSREGEPTKGPLRETVTDEAESQRGAIQYFSRLEPRRDGCQWLVATMLKGRMASSWKIFDTATDTFKDLPRHEATVTAATWDSAGLRLAVGDEQGTAYIYDGDGRQLLQRIAHHGAISALAFSADGRCLAMAGESVRVWDCQKEAFTTDDLTVTDRIPNLRLPSSVHTLVFDAKAERLAAVTYFGRLYAFAAAENEQGGRQLFDPVNWISWFSPVLSTDHSGLPMAPAFVNQDRGLLSLDENNGGFSWRDAVSGQPVHSLRIPPEQRLLEGAAVLIDEAYSPAYAISTDGTYLAVSEAKDVQLFDVSDGQPVGPILRHDSTVTALLFSRNSQQLLVGQASGFVSDWNVPDVQHVQRVYLKSTGAVRKLLYEGQDDLLTAFDQHALLCQWREPQGMSQVRTFANGRAGALQQVHLSGRTLMIPGSDTIELRSLRAVDVADGAMRPPINADGLIREQAMSPDGKYVATVVSHKWFNVPPLKKPVVLPDGPASLSVWSCESAAKVMGPVEFPESVVPAHVRYTTNGQALIVACARGELFLIEAATGQILHEADLNRKVDANGRTNLAVIEPPGSSRLLLRPSPDGNTVLVAGYQHALNIRSGSVSFTSVVVWQVESGVLRLLPPLEDTRCTDARFSPDGNHLVLAFDNGTVQIWDPAEDRLIRSLEHAGGVSGVRFDQHGDLLLTACKDGYARVWNWQTGELAGPPLAHRDAVMDACFAQDDRYVVTTGFDRTARVWDKTTGKPVAPPLALSGLGMSVTTSADGQYVVVAGATELIHVFSLSDLVAPDTSAIASIHDSDLVVLAELISSRRLYADGGGVIGLSPDDWLNHWRQFQNDHGTLSELFSFPVRQ